MATCQEQGGRDNKVEYIRKVINSDTSKKDDNHFVEIGRIVGHRTPVIVQKRQETVPPRSATGKAAGSAYVSRVGRRPGIHEMAMECAWLVVMILTPFGQIWCTASSKHATLVQVG